MYYYVVVAINSIGASPISNCQPVTVAIPGGSNGPGVPGYLIPWIMASIAVAVVVLMTKHRKTICNRQDS